MAQIIGLVFCSLQQLSKHICNKVKNLFRRCRAINQIVFLSNQWLGYHLHNFILAITLKANQLSTQIGATKIQSQEFTLLLTSRHTNIGAQHWHTGFLALQCQLHIKTQSRSNLFKLLLIQGQFINNAF